MQQEYRAHDFQKFSNLISGLLVDEKNNQLLMEKSGLTATNVVPLREANASMQQGPKCQMRHMGRSMGASDRGRQTHSEAKSVNTALSATL